MTNTSRKAGALCISPVIWKRAKLQPRRSSLSGDPVIFPESWSASAVDVVTSRFLKKASGERSLKSLVERVVETLGLFCIKSGQLESRAVTQNFMDSLARDILEQRASFNSPVWFNVGLRRTRIQSSTKMGFVFDQGQVKEVNVLDRPQVSACFIQSVEDDLLSIFDLLKNEARVFKFGSGTGTNFSCLRGQGEELVGGGTSSGLISFLEVFDRAAGAVKSGGTTRRAAKMVVLDVDHPDILQFIQWKSKEESKAQALIAQGYAGSLDGEAYHTVAGQNANHSVRVTDRFMRAVMAGDDWPVRSRTTKKLIRKIPAAQVFHEIAKAAWECGDPGVQFHDHIQFWNPCKNSGIIEASNPCSEYMFLNDSACNLASINLIKFFEPSKAQGLAYVCQLDELIETVERWLTAQDALVDLASYPTATIAQNSKKFRPLGLGFSNLGGLLIRLGVSYASGEARLLAAALMALIQGACIRTSAKLAQRLGAYPGYKLNKKSHHQVLIRHHKALKELKRQLSRGSQRGSIAMGLATEVVERASSMWDEALSLARRHGQRNAQLTAIAPTGTISFMMDCATTGIEPEFSLVRRKTLVGGGSLVLINSEVKGCVESWGLDPNVQKRVLELIHSGVPARELEGLTQEQQSILWTVLDHEMKPEHHLLMMSAVQPFVSGAISKTINLPQGANPQDIEAAIHLAWNLGLKAVAFYRDQSKVNQPVTGGVGTCLECLGTLELRSGCWTCTSCGRANACG